MSLEAPRGDAEDVPSSARAPSSARRAGLAARYRSLFVLGRGGMGTVEAALEIESSAAPHYQRVVALKRLLPDAAHDRRRVDMFLREARLAAMIEHPNVVRALDFGAIDGELYLAMEYVEGPSLAKVIRATADANEELPLDVVALLLAEVCRGLHAAHELVDPTTNVALNLVHRDVSPQNVLIGFDRRVRLLDFGVAKIETENVTKTGEVKGKTAYMSPEQAMGDPLDRRSDLFGVGALLFECLALRRMWGEGTDMEVIRKLALETPPALSASGRDVPEPLARLYDDLVAREAKARPVTAATVADALDALVVDRAHAEAKLGALLERHFADQAKAQRARLTLALDEVAPAQADELRQSLLPMSEPPPAAPATLPLPEAPRARKSSTLYVAVAVALAAGAIAAVGYALYPAAAPPPPPAPPALPSLPPTTSAPPPPTVAVEPGPVSSALPSASASVTPPPAVRPPRPSASAPRTANAPSASAPASASAKPVLPPAGVDPDPF